MSSNSSSGVVSAPASASRQLGVFEPGNDRARLLPPGGRDPSETRAEHMSKKAAARAAAAARQKEIEAQRAALLTRAPRLAVWDGDTMTGGGGGGDDAAALALTGLGRAGAGSAGRTSFTPRFDHICLAVSDVSHMADFLSAAGGRACEGFLTPVYLSSTFEFSNCAELQVIAPVESFAELRSKRAMGADERSTTTQAFWNGNTTTDSTATAGTTAAAAGAATATTAMPAGGQQQRQQQSGSSQAHGARSNAAGAALSSPSSSSTGASSTPPARVRSTFLQRYLRRHGPSVHHVAFLVPNLAEAKARFQSFGYTIYGWSDRDPLWKEFFLTPKQSLGVVIQVAESGSLQQNMSWQRSSAMLSQTHLTPVVKRHIAKMNLGEEEWAPAQAEAGKKEKEEQQQQRKQSATTEAKKRDRQQQQQASQGQGSKQKEKGRPLRFKGVSAHTADAANASASSDSPAAAGAAAVATATAATASSSSTASHASPSHSSSSSSPLSPAVRLELLGLRMRCSSEWKARRQWGDMLQASHCTVTIDPRTSMRTLTFRWPQSLMYIAVDIEKEPAGWGTGGTTGAAATGRSRSRSPSPDSSPSFEGDRSLAGSGGAGGAQWDGPKWLEMHAPMSASPVPAEAANTELDQPEAAGSTDAATSQDQAQATHSSRTGSSNTRSRKAKTGRGGGAASGSTGSGGSSGGGAGAGSRSVLPFSPTLTPLDLDPSIMRSRFVHTSHPMPLPPIANHAVRYSLVPLDKPLRAKM